MVRPLLRMVAGMCRAVDAGTWAGGAGGATTVPAGRKVAPEHGAGGRALVTGERNLIASGVAAGVASAAAGAGGAVRATTDAPEPLTDWPLMVFQPNATSVEAGSLTWEVATGEVICDPGTYRMHGLPEATSARRTVARRGSPNPTCPTLSRP